MVLHDLPTGAMAHLERFLDRARDSRRPLPPGVSAATAFRSARARSYCPIDPYVSSIEESVEP